MKIIELEGETKCRFALLDDKGKCICVFAEYNKVRAYKMQLQKAINKTSGKLTL